ncbi:hypothetical protein Pcinc_014498 [Petrolisthes cinctipes]|uniref:C2H2-type domain-containing protein n=1 Tax=Petrolisthes cinctipes TaxID=88211 RepID=A0AAE1FWV4_PETCI|nr:hypothetical protein Pcinc_014498 [Petrolisthes cinctipes]
MKVRLVVRWQLIATPSLLQTVAPVVCPVCGKSVSGINGKQKLRYHMLTHTGERQFQCPYCPHRASLKFNLNRHIRTVHRDQTIQSSPQTYIENGGGGSGKNGGGEVEALACTVCGKLIMGRNRRQRLQYHLSTHTGVRPHHCPLCPYRAHHKFTLDRHMRTVHRDHFPVDSQVPQGMPHTMQSHGVSQGVSVLTTAESSMAFNPEMEGREGGDQS